MFEMAVRLVSFRGPRDTRNLSTSGRSDERYRRGAGPTGRSIVELLMMA